MLYPALFPMLDMLTRILGKSVVIPMIVIFHFCDFIFSYALFLINLMPHPETFHNVQAFNIVITPIPRMFWAGILGSLIAGILEVVIYAYFQTRIKNFFIATYLSTAIVIIGHGLPTDYFAFIKAFPTQVWSLVISNTTINILILSMYVLISSVLMFYVKEKYSNKSEYNFS